MNASFYTAITGAKSQQVAVDTTGNNIANINTTGYRGSQIEFATLYSKALAVNYQTQASDQGLGSRVSATAIDMRAGTYQATTNTFDVAISGNGWFGTVADNVMDAKEVGYTRDGAFSVDRDGRLVNQSGHYVLGSTYGNLVNLNGQWQIDPSVAAGGLKALPGQGILTVPHELTYPASATTAAQLSGNLPGNENSKTARARIDTDLAALFDRYDRPMNIQNGESILLAAGGEILNASQGQIVLSKTVPGGQNGPLSFLLNGTAVTATWADGADAATIAAAIADAANTVSGISATASGNVLTINAGQSLRIESSSDTGLMADTAGAIHTYGQNGFTTLQDLQNALNGTLQSVYPGNAEVLYRHDGALLMSASDPVRLQIKATDHTNAALLSTLESLASHEAKSLSSLAFKQGWHKAEQKAVSPEGETLKLKTTLTQTRLAQGDEPAVWEAVASLQKTAVAVAGTDLGELIYQDEALGLAEGENLWFAFGKPPASVEKGYGYALGLVRDEAEGTAPVISFTLDNQNYSVTAADGADIYELQEALESVLHAAGYETSRSGSNLIIHPKGETLSLTNGASNLEGVVLSPMAIGKVTYGSGGVRTVEELADRISAIAAPLGAEAVFTSGSLALKNNGFSPVTTSVLGSDNSSEPFRKLLTGLNSALAPGATGNTLNLSYEQTLSSAGAEISFDQNGKITAPNTLTLDNGAQALEVTLDLTAWQQTAASHNFTQNGVVEGRLNGYTVDEHGAIIANFTNAKSSTIGQFAVYHFANDQGLMRIGGNLFMESANSGEPFFYLDENGNAVAGAQLKNQMLEGSNVQSALALTDLIVHQRAYEGNAKAITTSDELIKNAIGMKR